MGGAVDAHDLALEVAGDVEVTAAAVLGTGARSPGQQAGDIDTVPEPALTLIRFDRQDGGATDRLVESGSHVRPLVSTVTTPRAGRQSRSSSSRSTSACMTTTAR